MTEKKPRKKPAMGTWGSPRVTWGWVPLALLAAVIVTLLIALA